MIPLFPELRPYLQDCSELASEGAVHVITMRRDATTNLRTTFQKIIKRAGLTPWPKLFQNLRSTRETELAEVFPMHVVCQWMGNSQPVAAKHYLQVTDEHFERGAKSGAESGAQEAQNQAQQSGEGERTEVHGSPAGEENAAKMPAKRRVIQPHAALCAVVQDDGKTDPVGDEGLEPPTLSV